MATAATTCPGGRRCSRPGSATAPAATCGCWSGWSPGTAGRGTGKGLLVGTPYPPRGPWFRWYVCGLLLLATTVNYMDRQTLANAAGRVMADFRLTNEQYGELET